MYVNLLPCITWKWLRMNGTEVDSLPVNGSAPEYKLPAGWVLDANTAAEGSDVDARSNADIEKALFGDRIVTGVGPDMDRLVKDTNTPVQRITAAEGALVIENRYNNGDSVINAVEITVPNGVSATVIEKFYSDDDTSARTAFQTKAYIGKGSKLKLIQVQHLGSGVDFINDIGTFHDNEGSFELVEEIISGGRTYFGTRSNLAGKSSTLSIDMAYIVKGSERLESNICSFQRSTQTDSRIEINGVLKDEAFKLTKATIDFKTGSAGSKGEETEDVLMMSDNVVNQTVPLILCTEEDVEGVHGATLGRPSEEIMLYMQSRGLDESAVYEMMEKARIDALCSFIEDEKTVSEIRYFMHGDESED